MFLKDKKQLIFVWFQFVFDSSKVHFFVGTSFFASTFTFNVLLSCKIMSVLRLYAPEEGAVASKACVQNELFVQKI